MRSCDGADTRLRVMLWLGRRRQETFEMLTPDRTDLVAGSGATIASRLLWPPRILQL
jgi:hypothetical protein